MVEIPNGPTFFRVGQVKNRVVHFWLYIFGSPEQAKNYNYQMTATNFEEEFTYKGKVLTLDEDFESILARQGMLSVGIEAARRMKNEENGLEIKLVINSLGEETKSGFTNESD